MLKFFNIVANQNESLNYFYKNNNINFEIFNFSDDLTKYFLQADLAITRSDPLC